MKYTYTLAPSEDGKYIILKVKGDITRKNAMKQNIDAHRLGKKLGIDRFLVDLTESQNLEPIIENYQFAYDDLSMSPEINANARVIFLVKPEDHSHDFIVTTSQNAGHNIRLYRDKKKAMEHLLRD